MMALFNSLTSQDTPQAGGCHPDLMLCFELDYFEFSILNMQQEHTHLYYI